MKEGTFEFAELHPSVAAPTTIYPARSTLAHCY
ncbi:hypothetical protein V6Z11_A13G039900 [Gossypium hirsutum]